MRLISVLVFLMGLSAQAEPIQRVEGTPSFSQGAAPAMSDLKSIGKLWEASTPLQRESSFSFGSGCSVINPGIRDANGRYCSMGYGILFHGFILNDTCYQRLDDAYWAMESSRVCNGSNRLGYCSLTQPNERDQGNRFCERGYGVKYFGFIVDNTCHFRADDALAKMEMTHSCNRAPGWGRCRLTQHQERDRNQRFCVNSYGVAFDGVIMDNTCYFSLDRAMEVMQSSYACNRY